MNRGKIYLLITLMALTFCNVGCVCTSALWDNWPPQHYEPAPNTEIEMYQSPVCNDVLVLYTEQREKTGATRQRAYFAMANQERVWAMKKPRFVRIKLDSSWKQLPIEINGTTNPRSHLWAELSYTRTQFRLYRDGAASAWMKLPVYRDKLDQTEFVLLVPAAVAGDVVIDSAAVAAIGGLIYLGAQYPCAD